MVDLRLILHSPTAGSPQLEEAKDLLSIRGLRPAGIWITVSWSTGENLIRHQDVIADLPEDASILSAKADADAFYIFPQPLSEFTACIERLGVNVVQGRLVDFVAKCWRLHQPLPDVPIFEQCPVRANPFFRFPGNPGKVMLHRKHIQTAPGHHNYLASAQLLNFLRY